MSKTAEQFSAKAVIAKMQKCIKLLEPIADQPDSAVRGDDVPALLECREILSGRDLSEHCPMALDRQLPDGFGWCVVHRYSKHRAFRPGVEEVWPMMAFGSKALAERWADFQDDYHAASTRGDSYFVRRAHAPIAYFGDPKYRRVGYNYTRSYRNESKPMRRWRYTEAGRWVQIKPTKKGKPQSRRA